MHTSVHTLTGSPPPRAPSTMHSPRPSRSFRSSGTAVSSSHDDQIHRAALDRVPSRRDGGNEKRLGWRQSRVGRGQQAGRSHAEHHRASTLYAHFTSASPSHMMGCFFCVLGFFFFVFDSPQQQPRQAACRGRGPRQRRLAVRCGAGRGPLFSRAFFLYSLIFLSFPFPLS